MTETTMNLEVLEQKAERALEKAEQNIEEFLAAVGEIRDSGAYRSTGKPWPVYTQDRWGLSAAHLGRRIRDVEFKIKLEKGDAGVALGLSLGTIREIRQATYGDVGQAAEIIEERVRPALGSLGGIQNEKVRALLRSPGAVEQLEEQGVVVPPYPDGPTPEQRAYDRMAQLKMAAQDVQPENAARSIGSGAVAGAVLKDYEFLVPWINRFVAELRLYAEETGSL